MIVFWNSLVQLTNGMNKKFCGNYVLLNVFFRFAASLVSEPEFIKQFQPYNS